jgi:hypothetical protein
MKTEEDTKMATHEKYYMVFVAEGFAFHVEEEDDGKYVVEIALNRRLPPIDEDQTWARVVGRFDDVGQAITAAKREINTISECTE